MRCQSCDCNLSDGESARKGFFSGEYIDLCNYCFATIESDIFATEEGEDCAIAPEDYL